MWRVKPGVSPLAVTVDVGIPLMLSFPTPNAE
jgi:hypothetical protein